MNSLKYKIGIAVIVAAVFSFIAGYIYGVVSSKGNNTYTTPFGIINVDTAKVAMVDYMGSEPYISYVIHKDIAQKSDSLLKVTKGDTVWYCFTPKAIKYYLVKRDSSNTFQVWEWNRYNNVSWPEVTKYFKQEYIIVK